VSDHFTATIEITHTKHEKVFADRTHGRGGREEAVEGKRTVREVSRLVVRADSIDSLKERATSMIDLVEDYQ
jgi:hypothetical protein